MGFLEKIYSSTLKQLETNLQNERLFIKTNLKLARLWLDRKEYAKMMKIIRKLREFCKDKDESEDVMHRRGTHLLEIYALEIQMYTETKNNKKLKELYQQCLAVKSAIPHPKIMGIVYECGGKMHMSQKNWILAQQDFFEAFKNYDEAGSPQRITCLKYLVLANMLSESEINPFDSQETKPYKNDSQIIAMTNLVSAYQRKEIWEFEKILAENKGTIMDDPFIRSHIEGVLRKIRSQVLIDLVRPYKTVDLVFLSTQLGLNIGLEEIEELLISLILNEKIKGRIDQLSKKLLLDLQEKDDEMTIAMLNLAESMERVQLGWLKSGITSK